MQTWAVYKIVATIQNSFQFLVFNRIGKKENKTTDIFYFVAAKNNSKWKQILMEFLVSSIQVRTQQQQILKNAILCELFNICIILSFQKNVIIYRDSANQNVPMFSMWETQNTQSDWMNTLIMIDKISTWYLLTWTENSEKNIR